MKLKKIASLMLAGVMAVSMLSACGEGSGNGNGNEDENKPVETVSNAVTYANDMLDSDMKEYVNFISSTALDGWAAKYTTDTGKFSADAIEKAYMDSTTNGWRSNYHDKMEKQLTSDLRDANILVSSKIPISRGCLLTRFPRARARSWFCLACWTRSLRSRLL